MSNEDNGYDRTTYLRQLALDSLRRYSGGFAELEQMDRDLKSIIRSLADVADSTWTRSLLRQWGQLEIIYASALNNGRFLLTQEEEADVEAVVADLVEKIQSYEHPSPPNTDERS